MRSDEAPHERASGLGDLSPAVVDRERVAASRHLNDVGLALVARLKLVGSVGQCRWHRVVLFARDDEQGSAIRVLGVDLRLGPRVEVAGRGLEQRLARRRYRELLVQRLGLVLVDGVRERLPELLVRERNRLLAVRGVA